MDPRQFEEHVCEHFRMEGYNVELTSYSGDYGVDVFASKAKEKIAVQAKMYGKSRKINRQMVMELFGAKTYFDCTKAVIATNAELLPDALEVAKKLKIEIVKLHTTEVRPLPKKSPSLSFDTIWSNYIMQLKGTKLTRKDGKTNVILNVDWSGVERKTSNGKVQFIKIEIFKEAVTLLLMEGFVSRDTINQNYVGRASSGIILILSQVPIFELTSRPAGLRLI